jgi:2-hydroxychromene-2-carboxylate isomerase
MSNPTLEFWFDFASTYSYLSAVRVRALAQAANVALRFKPFLLGPIFKTLGWDTSPFSIYEAKGRHMWRDLERLAADFELPFRRPVAFPQSSLLAARIALVGLTQGWGEDYSVAVFRAEFEAGERIDDPATSAAILVSLNIDPQTALDAAQSDNNKARLRSQTEAAQQLGLFGAPSFRTAGGELFWGNDRLEQALDWARRESLS